MFRTLAIQIGFCFALFFFSLNNSLVIPRLPILVAKVCVLYAFKTR